MASSPPDLAALSLPELHAWQAALRGAIAALKASGGGEVALMADAEGVSVIFTVFFAAASNERNSA